MWVWLGIQAGVPTVAKDDEEVVVEEDTVVEWNGLERSACWITEGGCEMRGAVWERKGVRWWGWAVGSTGSWSQPVGGKV